MANEKAMVQRQKYIEIWANVAHKLNGNGRGQATHHTFKICHNTCLLCSSTWPHLKNNCQELKNLNFYNLDMGNYRRCHVD